MMFYQVCVFILTVSLHQQTEQLRFNNLNVVPHFNIISDIFYCQNSTGTYNVTLANDLDIEFHFMIYYHIKHSRRCPPSIPVEFKQRHHRLLILLVISGDISLNPGPAKHPCGHCYKAVAKNHRAVLCEACNYWWHIKCANISPTSYNVLCNSEEPWLCNDCNSFKFTNSFFDISLQNSTCMNTSNSSSSSESSGSDIFTELREARKKHINNFHICHLNINSMRYKFDELKPILLDKIVDCLIISETKLDSSFKDSLFEVDGYKLQRRDRTDHGGGIATFMRADIPARRRLDIEYIPRVRTTTYGKNSFKYTAAVLWNDLPDDFRKIANFSQFKNILKSWNGNDCKCTVCADF
ncbi:uncharacterized protein LOC134705924 [Mytilus trossulus]|uniref:uncharacterized protein LOC134705924 n=1 Tax=Mytilus trossulus TaxID=6551 RepID=UPI003004A842